MIFPEGTRRPPGAKPRYLPGVAFLYAELGLPCVPIALNSGLFWPRRSLRRHPGTVLVEVLDPIPPGLEKREFLLRLQNAIEEATARLVAEGERINGVTADWLPLEPLGDQMQIGLAIAERFQRLHRLQHIIAIGTRAAMTLPDMMHALRKRQPPGILHMAAIDDEAQRPHLPPRFLLELDPPHRFQIDRRHLLARAQIGDGLLARRGGDPKGDAAAHSAAVEPQHQAGPLRRAAMDKRIDAQRPVQADEPRRHAFDEVEARIPHQRAVAEDPEIFGAMPVEQFLHRLVVPDGTRSGHANFIQNGKDPSHNVLHLR